jgi:hypothetical protein
MGRLLNLASRNPFVRLIVWILHPARFLAVRLIIDVGGAAYTLFVAQYVPAVLFIAAAVFTAASERIAVAERRKARPEA